ncbi:hypothetical protein U1Q18_008472, partial [Sarracenia purpurea var. burkii]
EQASPLLFLLPMHPHQSRLVISNDSETEYRLSEESCSGESSFAESDSHSREVDASSSSATRSAEILAFAGSTAMDESTSQDPTEMSLVPRRSRAQGGNVPFADLPPIAGRSWGTEGIDGRPFLLG